LGGSSTPPSAPGLFQLLVGGVERVFASLLWVFRSIISLSLASYPSQHLQQPSLLFMYQTAEENSGLIFVNNQDNMPMV